MVAQAPTPPPEGSYPSGRSLSGLVPAREQGAATTATVVDEATLTCWAEEICPGHPIDVGIVAAVKALRDAGFDTFEACEGGEGHAYAEPTVRFEGDDAAGMRALAVLAHFPARRVSRSWSVSELEDRRAAGQPAPPPFWEVTFYGKLVS